MRWQEDSTLYASSERGRVTFPAFVRLSPSALPLNRRSLSADDQDFVKLVTFNETWWPSIALGSPNNFRETIARRWRILEDQIRAITVNLEGTRFLIETDEDWQEWVSTFFWRSKFSSSSSSRDSERSPLQENTIEPIHIDVILNEEIVIDVAPAGARARASVTALPMYSEVTAANNSRSVPTVQDLISSMEALNAGVRAYHQAQQRSAAPALSPDQHNQQQQQQQQQQQEAPIQPRPLASQPEVAQPEPRATPTAPPAQSIAPEALTASTLASNVVGSVLQALQPQLQGLPPAIASILSSLPAQLANAQPRPASASAASPSSSFPSQSVPTTASAPVQTQPQTSTSTTAATASNTTSIEPESMTERQSLIDRMFDELSRLRAQQASLSAPQPPPQEPVDTDATREAEGEMGNELGQAFERMLAQQRSAAASTSAATTAAGTTESTTATSTATGAEESGDEGSQTTVSTLSTTSSGSTRSRSRSRSRSPRRTTFLSTTTLSLLTIFTFILSLISPTLATPYPTSLNPTHLTLTPRDSNIAPLPRQNSRHLHLCKCTCFQTNSTLVPLYSPLDPAKPCSTCTRQFCLDQGLEMCKGAKLEHTDHDTGTGLEGDVWAKCFERDSGKDQGIITLYILVILGLVAWAGLKGRVEGWVQRYQEMGPQGLYSAVRDAPWRRSR